MADKEEKSLPEKPSTAPEASPADADSGERGLDDLGAIRIHNNVIALIAKQAALKVPGVVELSSNTSDGFAGMIGKKATDRGIHVEVDENDVTMEIHVVLAYGVRIPQVAWQLQTDVREAVENMTGKNVRSVNVVVPSVRMMEEDTIDESEGVLQ